MRAVVAVAGTWALVASAEAPSYDAMWKQFKEDFDRSYESNRLGDDEQSRFDIFKANVDKIQSHNAKNLSYTLGVNQFADLTADEFASKYLGGYRPELRLARESTMMSFVPGDGKVLDDAVDWVDKGAVTPVKDQGHCGSCWAFSTTGAIEGALFVSAGELISLSEEDLVQCDKHGDQGCNGGLMDHAFGWVKGHGICSEQEYPYTSGGGKRGKCRKPKCQAVVKVTDHEDVPKGDEDALQAAVAKQPVSIAIEADKAAFQLYKGGVLDSAACGKQLDHGVLLVGYGTDGGKDYWKVKNSWGEKWGEQGFIRMVRGKNMCGVAEAASYPTGAEKVGPSPGPSPPGPSPPPGPPGPPSHYEDPKDGCQSDEMAIEVQGLHGTFCSPQCTRSKCPTDVPEGVTADPECVLQTPEGDKYCALECTSRSECGGVMHCHKVEGQGFCTYNEDLAGKSKLSFLNRPEEIVV